MTTDTETIREALEIGAGFATPEQFVAIQAALAALGRVEERERQRAKLVTEYQRLCEGDHGHDAWTRFRDDCLFFTIGSLDAALAGSVAGEEQETA